MRTKRRRVLLGLLTALVVGVGSAAVLPTPASAEQSVCAGYRKLGSKGLTLQYSNGEIIRLWWYANDNGRHCAYTELRGVYYNTSTRWNIGVDILNGSTLVDRDAGAYFRYAGPVFADAYGSAHVPTHVRGWVVFGGTAYYVYLP